MEIFLIAIFGFATAALTVNGAINFYSYLTRDFGYLVYGVREDEDYFIADAIIDMKEIEIVRSKPYTEEDTITVSMFELEVDEHCKLIVDDMYRRRDQHKKWIRIVGFGASVFAIWSITGVIVSYILL